jgi:hypothetical protein
MSVTYLDLAIKLFGPRYRELPPSGIYDFYDVGVLYNAATKEIVIGNTTVVYMSEFVDKMTLKKTNGGGKLHAIIAQCIAEWTTNNRDNPPAQPDTGDDTSESEPVPTPDPPDAAAGNESFKVAPGLEDLDPNDDLGEGIATNHGGTRDKWNTLIDQARAIDMVAVAQAHGAKLRKSSSDLVGACPVCGTGDDRFAINLRKGVFNCRGCGKGGSGAIDLEMFLGGCEFVEAVKRLTNTTSLGTPRRSHAETAEAAARRERENEQYEAAPDGK